MPRRKFVTNSLAVGGVLGGVAASGAADVPVQTPPSAAAFNIRQFGAKGDGATNDTKPIAFKRCKHVKIRDVTIVDAPNYAISLLGTDYVHIDGVTILNALADGIDPDACHHVRISNCHIESHDDAICPKASFTLGERR